MHQFQYKYGDSPLAGYTIQRAAGRGGFGEVYYALSDGGRQVALKVVQNYEQIELRGIGQCMNMKSPHLVTIFDVKHNAENKPFVVMEYVDGPSLRDLINESPGGLGQQKAAFFLREIAKGLSFLHDCGIVHRDLKPGNIFYENGSVKIGDYGLSKAISTGANSGQTITVGTVNYMAPEIGAGRYDRSIDIYALGVILYEMLTGQVPFFGDSPAEVLLKHVSAEPDLAELDEPFKTVLRKSLAKDPADRYQTVQEMVEDIFGAEHVRNSVSGFSPEALSVVAERIAGKVHAGKPADKPAGKKDDPWKKVAEGLDELGSRLGKQVSDRIAGRGSRQNDRKIDIGANVADPIDRRQRTILSFVAMLVVSMGVGLLNGPRTDAMGATAALSFLMILGAVKGILWVRWRLLPTMEKGLIRNLAATGVGIFFAAILSVVFWADSPALIFIRTTLICLLGMAFFDLWKLTAPGRAERVTISPVVWAGILGLIGAEIFDGVPVFIVGVMAGTMLVIQIASPFGRLISKPATTVAKENPEKDVPVATAVPLSIRRFNPIGVVLSILGTLFLTAGFLTGLAVAVHVPFLLAAIPEVAAEMDEAFGYSGWPLLLEKIGLITSAILLISALVFIVFKRRKRGAAHIVRAVLAILTLVGALAMVSDAMPNQYSEIAAMTEDNNQIGPALESILAKTGGQEMVVAAILFVTAVLLLAWPGRQRPQLTIAPGRGGNK